MSNWSKEQLRAYEQRRSQAGRKAPGAKPKCSVQDDSLGQAPGKATNPVRYRVSIVSRRIQLLDPDNLAGGVKYFVDALRYQGLIPDDRPEDIELLPSQIGVPTRADECTEITVEEIA